MLSDACSEFLLEAERSAVPFLVAIAAAAGQLREDAIHYSKGRFNYGSEIGALKRAAEAVQENGLDDDLGIVLLAFARRIMWHHDGPTDYEGVRRFEKLVEDCLNGPYEKRANAEHEDAAKADLTKNLQTALSQAALVANPLARFHIEEAIAAAERGPSKRMSMTAFLESVRKK
jgi:hypothetical protein